MQLLSKTSYEGPGGTIISSSPIEWLSDDVLANIFFELAGCCLTEGQKPVIALCHPLITASHVCPSWRHILLDNPLLWSNIKVCTPEIWQLRTSHGPGANLEGQSQEVNHMKHLNEMTRTWITRSKNCRLSINIRMTLIVEQGAWNTALWPYYMSLIDMICGESKRWLSLETLISLTDPSHIKAVAGRFSLLQPVDIPLLETLRIDLLPDPAWRNADVPLIQGVQMGRALRVLRLPETLFAWQQYRANWSGLTDLRAAGFTSFGPGGTRCFSSREALKLLGECPRLITCYLGLWDIDLDSEDEGTPNVVSMPSLKVLGIRVNAFPPRPSVFIADFLDLPRIEEFQMLSNEIPVAIEHCLQHFGSSLRSVRFGLLGYVSAKDAEEILSLLPNITCLRFAETRYARVYAGALVMRALTLEHSSTGDIKGRPLCPKLSRVCYVQPDEVSNEGILGFLKSRRNPAILRQGIAMIEELEIYSEPGVPFRGLSELRRDGVGLNGLSIHTGSFNSQNRRYLPGDLQVGSSWTEE